MSEWKFNPIIVRLETCSHATSHTISQIARARGNQLAQQTEAHEEDGERVVEGSFENGWRSTKLF